jgi:hypothetical protein
VKATLIRRISLWEGWSVQGGDSLGLGARWIHRQAALVSSQATARHFGHLRDMIGQLKIKGRKSNRRGKEVSLEGEGEGGEPSWVTCMCMLENCDQTCSTP